MTKITKPTTTRKRGGKKFKKSLLQVDIASSESERPSNVCVTQPNHREIVVSNLNNNAKNLPTDQQVAEYLFLNELKLIETVESNNKIFPGYNPRLFLEFRHFLLKKNVNDFVNRRTGACNLKELYPVIVQNAWLSDIIIQQYFNLLKKNCNDNNIFIGNTYFFIDLEKYGVDIFLERYLKDRDLLSYSKIVIPTHIVNHWVLIVAEISKNRIIYYDSLDYFTLIYPKIIMLKSLINYNYISNLNTIKYNSFITDICSGMSPKQDNSSDCGIFTCTNARYNICNKPSTFKQEDIPLLRQRMFYEIVNNKLLPTE